MKSSMATGRKLAGIIGMLTVVFAVIYMVEPKLENPAITGDLQASPEVKAILRRACYDCHSNETQLSWFDKLPPGYWWVAKHVREGRKGLNFSTWDSLAPADQKGKLWEALNQVVAGAMPRSDYLLAHPSARLSGNDIAVLKTYIQSLAVSNVVGDTTKLNALASQTRQQMEGEKMPDLPKTLNGISYIPDYKNWEAISSTERYDNGTMRIIFGNDIAVIAIQEGHTNPWPNGTILAKVAWDEIEDQYGNISTGAFKQVEYMIKDETKYASTKGWGFARFKTPAMIPYGKTQNFATECLNCHQPMRANDYVFTIPIKH
jgi:hypothetical protein